MKLGLPNLDHSKSAVLDRLRSRESKRGYQHAIDEFIQWNCSEPRLSFSKVVVTRYRIFLENRNLAAGVRRVKGVKKLGVRLKLARGRGGSSVLAVTPGRHSQREA
jgi:hypothetical protein